MRRRSDADMATEALRRARVWRGRRRARLQALGILAGGTAACAAVVWAVLASPGMLWGEGAEGYTAQGTTGALMLRADLGGYALLGLGLAVLLGAAVLAARRIRRG